MVARRPIRRFSPVKDPRTVHALGTRFDYHMAQSVVVMRWVNLRSVNCYTDQNFKENAHFGALNLFTSEKKGLNKVIRRLSTLRTSMLTLSLNNLNYVYL